MEINPNPDKSKRVPMYIVKREEKDLINRFSKQKKNRILKKDFIKRKKVLPPEFKLKTVLISPKSGVSVELNNY